MRMDILTNFIWIPSWSQKDDCEAKIVYFRKEFVADEMDLLNTRTVRISADSRYKLYVNGNFIQEGPQKPLDRMEWFVDKADLQPFLNNGINIIAVEVLRYPECKVGKSNVNQSLLRTETPVLYVEDLMGNQEKSVSGKLGWKCCINSEIEIIGEENPAGPEPIHAEENVIATDRFAKWKMVGYDDSAWEYSSARNLFEISATIAPFHLVPRTIPQMRHENKSFTEISAIRDAGESETKYLRKAYLKMIRGEGNVRIPANTTQIVEIAAKAEECGYLLYEFARGRGASITTLCSECYAYPQPDVPSPLGGMVQTIPKKGDRTDAKNGQLLGHISYYRVAGYGTEDMAEQYEPYWFRTFRYIQLKIETADEPLDFISFSYRSTGYPLKIGTNVRVSDSTYSAIWDISVRTLARCMHETYMDCPFYEQLQYAMDSRIEMLYTYAISADDRLARQTMEAFRRSQRPDGMINANAPALNSGVIPGFSIYYILMIHDHMMYFGDRDLIRKHLPVIDGILGFFDKHLLSTGVVGKIGGPLLLHTYWSFLDWADGWSTGAPKCSMQGTGALTLESLLYLYGLQKAAELADYIELPCIAKEYRKRAESMKTAIQQTCFGGYRLKDGRQQKLLQDGPGMEEYSVHCQAFAVLTGMVTPKEGKEMLQCTVGNKDFAQPSVAFMFYLFRAMEICDIYDETDKLWDLWRYMLDKKMTTCVENNTDERSDCHAWSSLICYELPTLILGVSPCAPGYKKVRINPHLGKLKSVNGNVITPMGNISVSWFCDSNGKYKIQYSLPDGMECLNDVSQILVP